MPLHPGIMSLLVPDRIVRKLNRKRGGGERLTPYRLIVQGPQFSGDNSIRYTVGDEMIDQQNQYVFLIGQLPQPRFKERTGQQIDLLIQKLLYERFHLRMTISPCREIYKVQFIV